MKILLLDDDTILSESLKEYLELEAFSVDIASDADEAYELTFRNRYDLYIFDINLGKEDGFSVLKNLKEANDLTPTIYITALTDMNSIEKAFNIGADDYIKKPFDPEELVIRIKSRYLKNDTLIRYKNIIYNPLTKELKKDDQIVSLGIVGTSLLDKFLKNIGRVITHDELLELLETPTPNALRVNLAKLKQKLDIEFKNIREQGYIIEKVSNL